MNVRYITAARSSDIPLHRKLITVLLDDTFQWIALTFIGGVIFGLSLLS